MEALRAYIARQQLLVHATADMGSDEESLVDAAFHEVLGNHVALLTAQSCPSLQSDPPEKNIKTTETQGDFKRAC